MKMGYSWDCYGQKQILPSFFPVFFFFFFEFFLLLFWRIQRHSDVTQKLVFILVDMDKGTKTYTYEPNTALWDPYDGL